MRMNKIVGLVAIAAFSFATAIGSAYAQENPFTKHLLDKLGKGMGLSKYEDNIYGDLNYAEMFRNIDDNKLFRIPESSREGFAHPVDGFLDFISMLGLTKTVKYKVEYDTKKYILADPPLYFLLKLRIEYPLYYFGVDDLEEKYGDLKGVSDYTVNGIKVAQLQKLGWVQGDFIYLPVKVNLPKSFLYYINYDYRDRDKLRDPIDFGGVKEPPYYHLHHSADEAVFFIPKGQIPAARIYARRVGEYTAEEVSHEFENVGLDILFNEETLERFLKERIGFDDIEGIHDCRAMEFLLWDDGELGLGQNFFAKPVKIDSLMED